jgi:hypothetical protein
MRRRDDIRPQIGVKPGAHRITARGGSRKPPQVFFLPTSPVAPKTQAAAEN